MLTVRQTMRVIVEDVLRKHGVLTTDEIYRGVWAKHAQLGLLLPPRWQEEVRQVLEAHCISLRGNSWFLEKLEPLEERPDGEQIKNDSTKGQNRTDWASIESYRYLDRPLEFRTLNSTEISRSAVDRLPRRAPQSAPHSTLTREAAMAALAKSWRRQVVPVSEEQGSRVIADSRQTLA